MRILITGAQGQLGTALQQSLGGDRLVLKDLPQFDLTAPPCEDELVAAHPDVIIHAGAYTNVDGAEREPDKAMLVNVRGTEAVAKAAQRAKARLIVLSTDYVFDGERSSPYVEDDEPHPLNVYGRSKREAELAALAQCRNTLIVRTAWLYGPAGHNFVRTIMRLAGERSILEVVDDQRGSPTFAGDLADALRDLAKSGLQGICHVTNTGDATWYELAQAVVRLMDSPAVVRPIDTAQAGRLARRPRYSVLASRRLNTVRRQLPHWRDALARCMQSVQPMAPTAKQPV